MTKLREARIAAGLTMQQIVNRSGLARITVEKAEKSRTVAQVSAVRIVRALNDLSGCSCYTVEGLEIKTPILDAKKEASE